MGKKRVVDAITSWNYRMHGYADGNDEFVCHLSFKLSATPICESFRRENWVVRRQTWGRRYAPDSIKMA